LTTVKQQIYVENFSSLGAIAAEKKETDGQTDGRTDGQTDGRHNDFSRAHFLKKCALIMKIAFFEKLKNTCSLIFCVQQETEGKSMDLPALPV
jgi:hypothetical protein